MASPTMVTFCCSKSELLEHINLHKTVYNSVCLVTALVGLTGALYQIWAHSPNSNGRNQKRQSYIIRWLASSDAMACIGLLLRSVSWIGSEEMYETKNEFLSTWFCAVISAWIEYFYCATYLWTMLYAIDVHRLLNNRSFAVVSYHCCAWLLPLCVCGTGAAIMYADGFMCHDDEELSYLYLLPNYLAVYIPMVIVMVANPVIYYSSCKQMREQLCIWQPFRSSRTEEQMTALREKFLWITVVFLVIWFPNLLNGLILWTAWDNLPKCVILATWYIMAVLNPLQALLNVFVYRSWRRGMGCSECWSWTFCCKKAPVTVTYISSSCDDLGEDGNSDEDPTTPLLESVNSNNDMRGFQLFSSS